MSKLHVETIRTEIFPAGGNLLQFLQQSVPQNLVCERMVLAVTSKIVSLAGNRLVPRSEIEKKDLVRREADFYLGEAGYGCQLTIKEGLFIPSAGIDESNSAEGHYILYPKDPFAQARDLWRELRAYWDLKELGILLTDSRTFPLRWGVTGVCLSYWGFRAVESKIGTKDLFGRELQMTKINRADGLAAAAVLAMGEGNERTPLARLTEMDCEFCEEVDPGELKIRIEDDLYYPFFRHLINWPT